MVKRKMMIIPVKDARKLSLEIEGADRLREEIYRKSRDATKESKAAIYLLHRNETKEADALLKKVRKDIVAIRKSAKHDTFTMNIASPAFQEYTEAICLLHFLKNGKLPSSGALGLSAYDYLCGLSDLTGELGRIAVIKATKRDYGSVEHIRNAIDEIYGLMVGINMRNGDLRKKADAIKWNLKKVEEILYDIQVKRR